MATALLVVFQVILHVNTEHQLRDTNSLSVNGQPICIYLGMQQPWELREIVQGGQLGSAGKLWTWKSIGKRSFSIRGVEVNYLQQKVLKGTLRICLFLGIPEGVCVRERGEYTDHPLISDQYWNVFYVACVHACVECKNKNPWFR